MALTPEEIAAISTLRLINGSDKPAPGGLGNDGHRDWFVPGLHAMADVTDAVAREADAAVAAASSAAAQAASLSGTSATSIAIGTGSKTLTTQAGKAFGAGTFVQATSDASPTTHYMAGQVTAYSGTSLTINVTSAVGSGSRADWTIRVAGAVGPQGAQGQTGATGATGSAGAAGSQGPKGDTGGAGPVGPAPTLAIGTVTGTATASATISGGSGSYTLNLGLPKGDKGDKGDRGDQGEPGAPGSGSGDMVGPAGGVVDAELALFSGTTGKIVKGSGKTIAALTADLSAAMDAAESAKFVTPKVLWDTLVPLAISVSGGVATPNFGARQNFTLALTANTTLANPVNAKPGQSGTIQLTRSALQTLSYGAAWNPVGEIELPAASGAGAKIVYEVVSTSPLRVDFSVSYAGSGGAGGTVTSVGLSLPTGFTVTGSPVTASGTLTGAWAAGYQAYTAVEATKLGGIAAGADVTATAIGAATTKSTLVDTDAFAALNSEASGALVRVQWTAVKSSLKAYLDPIYEPFGRLSGINNQYEVSYTLTLADAGGVVEMAEVEANTLIVPANASVAFAVGTRVDIVQVGTGQTTIAAASGVTIRSADSKLAIAKQYAGASLYKRATNEWLLMGALK